jgi:hypothetical protein
MGIDPYTRYSLGRALQTDVLARARQAQAIRDVKARHARLQPEQDDVVSAPVQRGRHRLASLFGRPLST